MVPERMWQHTWEWTPRTSTAEGRSLDNPKRGSQAKDAKPALVRGNTGAWRPNVCRDDRRIGTRATPRMGQLMVRTTRSMLSFPSPGSVGKDDAKVTRVQYVTTFVHDVRPGRRSSKSPRKNPKARVSVRREGHGGQRVRQAFATSTRFLPRSRSLPQPRTCSRGVFPPQGGRGVGSGRVHAGFTTEARV